MAQRRQLLHQRYWQRVNERRRRLAPGTLYRYRVAAPPELIDYWGHIPATLPEKLVFAELVRRGISFYFSYMFGDFPFTPDKEERYRPDFILPEYRMIIEVAGVYWHTRPEMYEYDKTKTELYVAAGYTVITLTDKEVMADVVNAINKYAPILQTAPIRTGQVIVGERPINPTAAITARIRRYPKVVRLKYRKRSRGPVGIASSYEPVGKAARPIPDPIDPLFRGQDLSQERVKELTEYGAAWGDWMDQLGEYFEGHEDRQQAYPDLYNYYLKWRDWWNKFQIT